MGCCSRIMCYNCRMSSNERYRGNREYRDLTVQTHYKESGRPTRVQTRGSLNDMKFSNNSVDARKPYEDTDLIYRTRYQAKPSEGVHSYGDYGKAVQAAPPRRVARPERPAPQQYRNQGGNPQVQSRPAPQYQQQQTHVPEQSAPRKPAEPKEIIDTSPKVSKEQALQIDMMFKIGIMVWAAAALVTTIVLLTR